MSVSHDQVKVLLQSQQSFKPHLRHDDHHLLQQCQPSTDQNPSPHHQDHQKIHNFTHTSQKGSDPFLDVQLKQLIVASPEIEIGLISNYDLDQFISSKCSYQCYKFYLKHCFQGQNLMTISTSKQFSSFLFQISSGYAFPIFGLFVSKLPSILN